MAENDALLASEAKQAIMLKGTTRRLRVLHEAVGLLPSHEVEKYARDLLDRGGVTKPFAGRARPEATSPPRPAGRGAGSTRSIFDEIFAGGPNPAKPFPFPFAPFTAPREYRSQKEHDENCLICNPNLIGKKISDVFGGEAVVDVFTLDPTSFEWSPLKDGLFAGKPFQPELLEPISLVAFLGARGWQGYRLAKVIGEFAREVKKAYVTEHSEFPPKRAIAAGEPEQDWYEGPDDLTLIEKVYAERMESIQAEVFGPRLP